jgi:TldD protein
MLMAEFDGEFFGRPLADLAGVALERARALGCSVAQVRIEQLKRQQLSMRDSRVQSLSDDLELGIGIRVLVDGSIGFASSVDLRDDSIAALCAQAVEAARATAWARSVPVELADEPAYGKVSWISPYRIDPVAVPVEDKIALFLAYSDSLLSAPGIDHVFASLSCVTESKFYADLAGTEARQQRVRVHPVIEALGLGDDGEFETMRTLSPPVGRGYEYLLGEGGDLGAEIAEMPELLAEKLAAPSVRAGNYDVVIDASNLWLTIHESVGHATELDRALGYEAAYAGTSFATPERLGNFAYGSPLMNITGDRTVEYGLASIDYDDEGVKTEQFDIVREGTFVGYQLDRQFARLIGASRSNGCSFADSPLNAPIQRMANISLASSGADGPSTSELIGALDDGIYIVGDKSWSIDMQRYNFQFTGQRFYAIKNGRLAGQVRDVAYQASTPQFWGSLDALGGDATYVLGGAMNCGKGQPGQTAPVSHGCPTALFRNVRILNTKEESGR